MKINAILSLIFLTLFISACGGGDDDSGDITGSELGSFVGTLSVNDDPLTELGNVTNGRVTITRSGSDATIIVTGDYGLSREYEGEILSEVVGVTISLLTQTEPTESNVGGTIIILGNELNMTIDVPDDTIAIKDDIEDIETIDLSGKLRIAAINFILE